MRNYASYLFTPIPPKPDHPEMFRYKYTDVDTDMGTYLVTSRVNRGYCFRGKQ